MKLWSSTLVLLVALAVPAAAIASSGGETVHFSGSLTQATTNPCTGSPGTESVTFKGVAHTSVSGNGSMHHTATVSGQILFVPDDSSQPTYAGKFTAWDGQNGALDATITSTAAFHTTLTGSDGSRISNRGVFHVTLLADGTVTAAVDRFTFVCETR
jgi:hypothetical protein